MIPQVPHIFRDGDNVDPTAVNRNFQALAESVNDNRARRYTRSAMRFELDGVTDASAQVLREFAIRLPAAGYTASVERVELTIYATSGVAWSVACSDATFPGLSVTGAGSTTEAHGMVDAPIPIASESSDLTFTLSAPAASTITAGELVLHIRADRGAQGDPYGPPAPPTFDASTSTDQATIQGAFDDLLGVVTDERAATKDLRVECFTVRSSSSSYSLRIPSGQRHILHARVYLVGSALVSLDVSFATPALTVPTVAGGGVTVRTTGAASASGSTADDPMDTTDDTVLTWSPLVGASVLGYVVVWWQ